MFRLFKQFTKPLNPFGLCVFLANVIESLNTHASDFHADSGRPSWHMNRWMPFCFGPCWPVIAGRVPEPNLRKLLTRILIRHFRQRQRIRAGAPSLANPKPIADLTIRTLEVLPVAALIFSAGPCSLRVWIVDDGPRSLTLDDSPRLRFAALQNSANHRPRE